MPITLKDLGDAISFAADLLTIVTSVIAIVLLVKKGPAIASAVRLLINFSFQTTLAELRQKLERLNEYHAADPDGNIEIVNIFHELHGQISGNPRVLAAMPDLAQKLQKMLNSTKAITEPRKRAMISEMREVLRNMDVESIEKYLGENG
jgi:DNA-binding GntR family transcriptional regulator